MEAHTADADNSELLVEREGEGSRTTGRESLSSKYKDWRKNEQQRSSSSREKSQEEEMPKDKVVTLV